MNIMFLDIFKVRLKLSHNLSIFKVTLHNDGETQIISQFSIFKVRLKFKSEYTPNYTFL